MTTSFAYGLSDGCLLTNTVFERCLSPPFYVNVRGRVVAVWPSGVLGIKMAPDNGNKTSETCQVVDFDDQTPKRTFNADTLQPEAEAKMSRQQHLVELALLQRCRTSHKVKRYLKIYKYVLKCWEPRFGQLVRSAWQLQPIRKQYGNLC